MRVAMKKSATQYSLSIDTMISLDVRSYCCHATFLADGMYTLSVNVLEHQFFTDNFLIYRTA